MIFLIYILSFLLLLIPVFMRAQTGQITIPDGNILKNPLKVDSIPEFINALLDIVIEIGLPVIVLMVIYSGFLFIRAQGNEEGLRSAKATLFWTIIGAAVILGAAVISKAIQVTIKNL